MIRFVKAALALASCLSAISQLTAAEIVFSPSTPGRNQVFVIGETIAFSVSVQNKGASQARVNLSLEFVDYFGKAEQVARREVSVPARGAADVILEVKMLKTGSFTPLFKAAGAADASWTTVAVVPQPVEGEKPLSIFGISGTFDDREQAWELMRLMGVKWARGDLAWPQIQQASGTEWKPRYDNVLAYAKSKQMGILATVGYTGNFAAQEYEGGYARAGVRAPHTAPIKPECLRDWENFCGRLARDHGVIKYWEIWNEADLSFYYGTPGEYMAMHKAAWCAIKRDRPDAIIMGGNSCACPYFIKEVIPDGFMEYSDAFSAHYPFSFDTPIGWDRSVSGYIKPNVEKTGFRKPAEMTEGGNLIYAGRGEAFGIKSDFDKTRILVKEHMFNCRQGLGKFFQFTLHKGNAVGWGFLPEDLSHPYPHFVSHAVMASLLEDHDYVGHLEVGPEFSAFVFQKNMQPVTVLWKGDYIIPAGSGVLSLDTGTKNLTRMDLMGGRAALGSATGVYSLELDQDPVYLLGGDKRLMARATAARAKPILSDLRRILQTAALKEAAGFLERICAASERRREWLSELKYHEAAEGFTSPLADEGVEKLLAEATSEGAAIPAYNVFHKLCELAEIEWLQFGLSGGLDGDKAPLPIEQLKDKLASTKAQIEKANGPAAQVRVNDVLLWAKLVIAHAERGVNLNGGRFNAISAGQACFANDLLDQALMLSRYEPKRVLNVFLTLDLPESIHQGGRWERKVLVKADGDSLKTLVQAKVCNRLNTTAKGSLKLNAPEGWRVAPSLINYEAAPNEDKLYVFELVVPEGVAFRRHDGELRLTGTLGEETLLPATQPIEIWAPIALTVRTSGSKLVEVRSAEEVMDIVGAQAAVVGDSGKIGQTDVAVSLDNWDKRAWSGELSLILPEGWSSKPKAHQFEELAHYQQTSLSFTVFYPPEAAPGPNYTILARAYSGGKLIGLGVTGNGGQWKYKEGSDPSWKEREFDDSSWEYHNTEHVQKHGYVGDVWFRTRVFIPKSWGENDLLADFGFPAMAFESFWNGHKVGGGGAWPPLWSHSWGDYAEFIVDKGIVDFGGWNTIAVRCFIPYSSGGITPGFVRPTR